MHARHLPRPTPATSTKPSSPRCIEGAAADLPEQAEPVSGHPSRLEHRQRGRREQYQQGGGRIRDPLDGHRPQLAADGAARRPRPRAVRPAACGPAANRSWVHRAGQQAGGAERDEHITAHHVHDQVGAPHRVGRAAGQGRRARETPPPPSRPVEEVTWSESLHDRRRLHNRDHTKIRSLVSTPWRSSMMPAPDGHRTVGRITCRQGVTLREGTTGRPAVEISRT